MSKVNKKTTTANHLGGKALGLNLLTELGYTVPAYYVVPFDQDINTLEFKSEINKFSLKFNRFAVRSSANIEDGMNVSFAGQFSSYLDVPKDEVLERIEDVRNSIKTEHVKRYCKAMDMPFNEIKMNVIVQRFEEPSSGGVWMGNGVSGGRLEWVEGRGDSVVNGEVTPFYESYGETGELINKNNDQLLEDKSGKPVAEYCKEIQAKLGYDADLEFCITKEGVQWLQLRRVTRETTNAVSKDNSLVHNIINGEAASPHLAKGIAYRLDQTNGDNWSPGKILVARATSPNDMLYIMTSNGVVTKMGGMLSHAAVVCRELGKACVVGVDIEKIQHGREISIDGRSGKIELL